MIAVQPDADAISVQEHPWSAFLRGDAGPCAWAVRPAEIDAEATRLRASGIDVTLKRRSGRERPDGVKLEWRQFISDPQLFTDEQFGAHIAAFAGSPIVLAAPLSDSGWLHERVTKFGEIPAAFILGAKPDVKFISGAQSRWSGKTISWFDPQAIGWRPGIQH